MKNFTTNSSENNRMTNIRNDNQKIDVESKCRTILIVDDEPALLSALVDKFTRAGYTVLVAIDGKEGLNIALKHHPNIILLDIIMPVMDGISMVYKLREDSWGKRAKVLLLTNLSDPGKITKVLTQKVNGYLVKSDWKIEDIVKEVNKKLTV